MEKDIIGVAGMAEEAMRFTRALTPSSHATIITLSGPLGAGKTTFVQGIARALGV